MVRPAHPRAGLVAFSRHTRLPPLGRGEVPEMRSIFWRGVRGGSPGARAFALYVAIALIVAIAGPALAIDVTPGERVADAGSASEPTATSAPVAEPTHEAPAAAQPAAQPPVAEKPAGESATGEPVAAPQA